MGMYAEQPVTIKTDSMRRIDLEEVMIHATKTGALLKDLPNRVEVVTKRQIEASGINNLTDLLKNFVNVDVIEYPGYNSYFSNVPSYSSQNRFELASSGRLMKLTFTWNFNHGKKSGAVTVEKKSASERSRIEGK